MANQYNGNVDWEDVVYLDEHVYTLPGLGADSRADQRVWPRARGVEFMSDSLRSLNDRLFLADICDGAAIQAVSKYVPDALPLAPKPPSRMPYLLLALAFLVCLDVVGYVITRPSVRALEDTSFVEGAGR